MSQNGRSSSSVGQGSRGIGAAVLSRSGDPGLSGERISLLKRYNPPVGAPFILSLKAAAMGVGKVGKAGSLAFASLPLKLELIGVFGDISEPSSAFGADKFRVFMFLRLEDEKFLRSPDRDWVRPGEPERGFSFDSSRGRGGVGGRWEDSENPSMENPDGICAAVCGISGLPLMADASCR